MGLERTGVSLRSECPWASVGQARGCPCENTEGTLRGQAARQPPGGPPTALPPRHMTGVAQCSLNSFESRLLSPLASGARVGGGVGGGGGEVWGARLRSCLGGQRSLESRSRRGPWASALGAPRPFLSAWEPVPGRAPPPPAVAKGGPPHRPTADRLHHDLAAPLQPDHRTLLPRPALPAFASRDILETSGSCFRGTGPEGARSPFQMGPGLEKPSELVCPQSSQGTPAALAPNRDPCIKEAAPCARPPLSFQSRGLHLCCVGMHPPR